MEQHRSPLGPRPAPGAPRSRPATPPLGEERSAPPEGNPSDDQGAEHVVLAVGAQYFHDGRVGVNRYASDLTSSFIGAVAASHVALRGLFEEVGAPTEAPIEAVCDRFRLRFGVDVGQAHFTEKVETPTDPHDDGSTPAESRQADEWVRGLVAVRDADHAGALAAFESEASEAAAAGSPQRAAIAYRAASSAASAAGRSDHANRLLRLAGKAYLEIAERPETIPQGVFMAFREGARCFLEAGNLPLAHKCLSKAIAIGETLGYTESA